MLETGLLMESDSGMRLLNLHFLGGGGVILIFLVIVIRLSYEILWTFVFMGTAKL